MLLARADEVMSDTARVHDWRLTPGASSRGHTVSQ
jgi:hypothetical protein